MKIPRSVNQLTIIQYSRFIECELSEIPEEDKVLKLLSIVMGINVKAAGELPLSYITKLNILRATQINPRVKRIIWVKGKRYRLCKDESELNTNQYTALKQYQEQGYRNYHNIAAVFYIPAPLFGKAKFNAERHGEIARSFLSAKVGDVFGALFFYSRRSKISNLISQISSQLQIQKHMKEVMEWAMNTDGMEPSTRSQVEMHLKKMSI